MDNEYYINVGDLRNKIYSIGLGGGSNGVAPSTVAWAAGYPGVAPATGVLSTLSTNLATAGGTLLKDMGRTYLSAGRTFRKVQLVVPQGSGANHTALSTFGVGGKAGSALPEQDFYTGYIEVGFDLSGDARPAPVAKWGR
jgi:hypothetical protein